MKYLIREKIFALTNDFTIKDENESPCYEVQSKFLTIGKKLHFRDMSGTELLYIEQQLFKFLPEYFIYDYKKNLLGKVKKKLSFITAQFDITSSYGNYQMEGDLFRYNFVVRKNGLEVARVSKKFFSFTDHYGVDVADNEDQTFMLALIIVIDQIVHDNKGKNN
ncbi:uncharacterized protein YxjI [Natranaerovirga hydrolytica]|uniref:Uncharacterized protein YxjI n=1 Tax=Natranaerovirga hydrolytica TaxID=680378 RepID=A0A4R1MI46_9FIRM|nr:LURP-one-related family protein [Natranaerovirga hydrolytica]TCK92348.1 uncharacterized protein YxjI [Natranaerovirga hydrolytica]